MKFLLNMNVPRQLGQRLAGRGHACRHVGDVGMAEAGDPAIVAEARANGETIITHDLDYGHLLAFSGRKSPSVIIIRMRNSHPERMFARLAAAWPKIEGDLSRGAIAVIEDGALRIRVLPIAREQ